MEAEVWKPVLGYEGLYEVSNYGNVKSLSREVPSRGGTRIFPGRVLKPIIENNGYKNICLSKKGKSKKVGIHRLVALAFIGNPDNKPFINHIDVNPSNNYYKNLEWCTPKENSIHGSTHGNFRKGEVNNKTKLTEEDVKIIRASNLPNTKLAKLFNVHHSAISLIKRRKVWKHIIKEESV